MASKRLTREQAFDYMKNNPNEWVMCKEFCADQTEKGEWTGMCWDDVEQWLEDGEDGIPEEYKTFEIWNN